MATDVRDHPRLWKQGSTAFELQHDEPSDDDVRGTMVIQQGAVKGTIASSVAQRWNANGFASRGTVPSR